MSINALRRARAAVLALTIASPALVGALADEATHLVTLDEPTAFALEMLEVIEFVGSDEAGNGFYASAATGSVDFVVAGTPSTVSGGNTGGVRGNDIITGGSKSAS